MHSGLLGFPRNAQFPSHFWQPKGRSRPHLSKTRESVSITDFGAVPGVATADQARKNAAAIAAATATGQPVYVPNAAFHTENVFVNTACPRLYGPGTLIAAGTLLAFNGLLEVFDNTGLVIEGIGVLVDFTVYPQSPAVRFVECFNILVEHVRAQGEVGIYAVECNVVTVTGCQVDAYKTNGINMQDSFNTQITENRVSGGAVGSVHGIGVGGGSNTVVTDNIVSGATIFGISIAGDSVDFNPFTFAKVANNVLLNGLAEGININNTEHFSVTGNVIFFSTTSIDFGLSLFGPSNTVPNPSKVRYGVVTGNLIFHPWKSGIGIDDDVKYCLVSDNLIISPNQGDGATEDFTSGVVLIGANCQFNTVVDNYIRDLVGNMDWLVNESSVSTVPSNNIIGPNYGPPGLLGRYRVQGAGTEPAWKPFTPIITASAGAFTTVSAAGRYRIDGKTLRFGMAITITTNGTAAGAVLATLPFAALAGQNAVAAGRNDVNGGAMLQGNISGSSTTIRKYDNGYPGSDGEIMRLSGAYEMA